MITYWPFEFRLACALSLRCQNYFLSLGIDINLKLGPDFMWIFQGIKFLSTDCYPTVFLFNLIIRIK